MSVPALLTAQEVAHLLRVSAKTVERLRTSAALGHVQASRRIFFTERYVADYLENAECPATPAKATGSSAKPVQTIGIATGTTPSASAFVGKSLLLKTTSRLRGSPPSGRKPNARLPKSVLDIETPSWREGFLFRGLGGLAARW